MFGRLDIWLVNRVDALVGLLQERQGLPLPLIQACAVALDLASYWLLVIAVTLNLGVTFPWWATITYTTFMLGFAIAISAFYYGRRIRILLRDARGDWTAEKAKRYLAIGAKFRLVRTRWRLFALIATAIVGVGALLGVGAGLFACFLAATAIEEFVSCAFPRAPQKNAAWKASFASGHA